MGLQESRGSDICHTNWSDSLLDSAQPDTDTWRIMKLD